MEKISCALLFVCSVATAAFAGDAATAKLTSVALDGGGYHYMVVLTNTGTVNLETFWYAWLPGKDFLPSLPTGIESPTGWTAVLTGGNANNGHAIQWLTSSSATPVPLTPGSSLTFGFDSVDTPAALAGNSPFYPGTPVGTSIVYGGAPFSDAGFQFVVASDLVPFFDGEISLTDEVDYLALPGGTPFGFYTHLSDAHYIYHFDLGYEYVLDAEDVAHGVYLYDFTSGGWFYTSPGFPFPWLYDYNRGTAVYLFADPSDPYRYSVNGVRYFYDYNAKMIITK